MIPAKLRNCPECGGHWPNDPDHALRGCGWLYGLPRSVSPSNNDTLIHDGIHGRDRFLQFELKSPQEPWPPAKGQFVTLVALAKQPNWTVRILRGFTNSVDLYRVAASGIDSTPIRTHVEAVRKAVISWLGGTRWVEAEQHLASAPPSNAGHTCGWARVAGVWTCIQDHYAVGFRPDTACGKTLPTQDVA